MSSLKVAIVDSGIGGLSIIPYLNSLPLSMNVHYIADTLNIPYGAKTDRELTQIASELVERYMLTDFDTIILACNTLTVSSINSLRSNYPHGKFIGIEPFVSFVGGHSLNKKNCSNSLLLVTERTAKSKRLQSLVSQYQAENKLEIYPCPGLATLIENKKFSLSEKDFHTEISHYFRDVPHQYGSIILGCTHYLFAKDNLSQIFPQADIIHPLESVTQHFFQMHSTKRVENSPSMKLTLCETSSHQKLFAEKVKLFLQSFPNKIAIS